jgi:hypothetical protein
MAAGLGFKDFVTGEVLTAADVDGYLMQGVWVFASATARDAAVTSPQEGNFAYLKDTNVTTYYTGSAWANLDTTGMTNPMTTTGDTIYSSSGSTPARLGIGTAGQVLQVNSGATAPEWATPASGGGMTSLASGSLPTGSGTLTLSSISGSYKNLQLVLRDVQTASQAGLRLTVTSSTVYDFFGLDGTPSYQQIIWNSGSSFFEITRYNYNTGDDNSPVCINIYDYANTSAHKLMDSFLSCKNDRSGNPSTLTKFWAVSRNTAAVDSITLQTNTGNYAGGTYILYGVS